jgi:hypothetical protein
MDKKTIKSFYLSLIDNPEAVWTSEKDGDCTLYHCQINNINIKMYRYYRICFMYTGSSGWNNDSDLVSFSDIGISKFHLLFPYFGVVSRIAKRVKKENINKEKKLNNSKIESVTKVLSKDKSLVRDTKLEQLLK